jgi:FixJ family two-component response regulator
MNSTNLNALPHYLTNPSIFIVEDDEDVTNTLSLLLKSVGYQSMPYRDPEIFLNDYRGEPGCLLCDIRLRGMSGLKLQAQLKQRDYQIPTIFMTGYGDVRLAVRAMKAGAHDFFMKPFNNQELLDSIHHALETHQYIMTKQQQSYLLKQRLKTLTGRELQILHEVIQGKISKIIAHDLNISQHTVELHRTKIMRKMQVSTVGELIHLAMRYNLFAETEFS